MFGREGLCRTVVAVLVLVCVLEYLIISTPLSFVALVTFGRITIVQTGLAPAVGVPSMSRVETDAIYWSTKVAVR